MFVKFTLTPQGLSYIVPVDQGRVSAHKATNTSGRQGSPAIEAAAVESNTHNRIASDFADEGLVLDCCCGPAALVQVCATPDGLWRARPSPPVPVANATAAVRRLNAECDGNDVLLGIGVSLELCLDLCRQVDDCVFVAHGTGRKRGHCFWQLGDCTTFEEDAYVVYDVRSGERGTDGSNATSAAVDCTRECAMADRLAADRLAADEKAEPPWLDDYAPDEEGIDLLITEEGWGLSSANWLIRRSEWSIAFLDRAFELCHQELPLFGDQDAMIHLLLNRRALQHDFRGDPLDAHAVIIPQRELNAYDALNAHYMGCDGYAEGDLLVTFPGCKDPAACNPLFRLAAAHAQGPSPPDADSPGASDAAAHVRLFGPPEVASALYEEARGRRRGV